MITWINVLHLYQPPTQSKDVLDRITHESYLLILSLLKKYPHVKMTINIPGSLLELFDTYGHRSIIEEFAQYAQAGRIELLGTAMYHALLPLIPAHEVRRQIELHTQTSKKYFGDAYTPRGFYLPEMAYSNDVGAIIKDMGFEWILLDEIHAGGAHTREPVSYKATEHDLTVVFRNRSFSQTFPPERIIVAPEQIEHNTLITVHDGEMYGHRHTDDRGYFERVFNNPNIQTKTVSEYIDSLDAKKSITLFNASWETTPDELATGIPYAVWNDPQNALHQKLWTLAYHVLEILSQHENDPNFTSARHDADMGIASCYWWWASERKLGAFSPISWNPTEIEKGASLLLNASRSLLSLPYDEHEKIEQLFSELRNAIWERHWVLNSRS